MNGEQTLRRAINFAVKYPEYVDFAETLLEVKYLIKEWEKAELRKDIEYAHDCSMALTEASMRLEEITLELKRKKHEQK